MPDETYCIFSVQYTELLSPQWNCADAAQESAGVMLILFFRTPNLRGTEQQKCILIMFLG